MQKLQTHFFVFMFLLLSVFDCCGQNATDIAELSYQSGDEVSFMFSYSFPIPFRIYLPSAYKTEGNLPVLYLLHGQAQDETLWDELNIRQILDNLIENEIIKPIIVVMPRETHWYENMEKSEFANQLLGSLIPLVETSFPVSSKREHRAIGGISRGASWAQYIAVNHYNLFGVLGQHSLPMPYYSDYMLSIKWRDYYDLYPKLKIYIDTGADDPYYSGATDFSIQLSKIGHPHTYILSPGDHDSDYWGKHIREYLIWYANALYGIG